MNSDYLFPPSKTFEELARLESYIEVPWMEGRVSDKPLFTDGLECCKGIILYDGSKAALLHLVPSQKDRAIVQAMIDQLDSSRGIEAAMVLSEIFPYEVRTEEFLREKDIPLRFLYEGPTIPNYDIHWGRSAYPKDLIVIPSTGEVRICVKNEVVVFKF